VIANFVTKPNEFKQSEIGEIPIDWSAVKLGDYAEFKTGPFGSTLHKSDYVDDGIPVINPMQIIDGRIVPTSTMAISEAAAHKLSEFLLRTGNVVIGRRGDMGRCAVVEDHADGWLCGTGSVAIRPKPTLHSGFLQRQISSPLIVNAIESTAVGTTMINLNQATLSSLYIPLPPTLAEQEAIAGALSDTDDWIESLEELIAKKRHLKQAAMQQLLTGKKRLPGFDGEWEVKRLGDVLTIMHGKSQKSVEISGGEYPILATGGQIGSTNSFLHDKPSVLIGRKGTIDRPQYADTPFWTVDTLFYSAIHEPNNARFLYYRFCLIDWRSHNEASGVPSLNSGTIEGIEIDIPNPAEQTAIAKILTDMDAEIAAIETKLTKARQIKQGMMSDLLTGKIRLVDRIEN